MKFWNSFLIACFMLLAVAPAPADAATRLKTKTEAASEALTQEEVVKEVEKELAQNNDKPLLAAEPAPAAKPAPAPAPVAPPTLPTAESIAKEMQKALTTPATPETPPLDKIQIQRLIKTMQTPRERQEFINNLRGLLAADGTKAEKENLPPGERALNALSDTVTGLGKNFSLIGKGFADLPQTVDWIHDQVSNQETRDWWLKLFAITGLALLAGTAALFGVRFLLRGPRGMLAKMPALPFPTHLLVFISYHFLTLMPIVGFTLASLFTAQSIEMPAEATQATVTFLYAFIVLQLCMWLLKMIFASSAAPRRLLPMPNETAAYLYVWLVRLSGIIIFGTFLSRAALLVSVPENTVHAFASLMGLVVTLMVVIIVLQNRRPVADWLRGKPEKDEDKKENTKEKRKKILLQSVRQHLSGVWHVLAIIYLLGGYLVATLDVEQGFATLTRATVITVLVLLGFHFLLRGIDRLIASGFALPAELRRQFPRLEERTNSYIPILQRALKVIVWGAGIVVLLGAWGVDTMAWFTENPGQKFFSAAISIAVTLVLTVLLWELVGSMVERYLRGDDKNGKKIERSARMRTLLPLGRYAVQVVLIIVAGVIILSELGVNTTPLLAGAGIIGLAIGFGSQALVKDIISGLFILMEDTLSVGDIVKAGSHSGVVEGITIRTVRLRDGQGYLHTVPFGELTNIINMTRHFANIVFEIPVAFDADWRKVMQVMKDLAEEMRNDEKFQKAIYEPIQIQGIDRYETSWAIIMGVLKVQPLQQWNVKREYLLRLKERLDEENIPLPYSVALNTPLSMMGQKAETAKSSRASKASVASKKVAPAKSMPPAESKDQAKALKNLEEANPPLPAATKA
jgi:moderate conductance mechanosensitive channel